MKVSDRLDTWIQRLALVGIVIIGLWLVWARGVIPYIQTPGEILKVGDSLDLNLPAGITLIAVERSTCPYCQRMKPIVSNMLTAARTQNVNVRYISAQLDGAEERAFARSIGFSESEILFPGKGWSYRSRLKAVPTILILKDRTIVHIHIGGVVDEKQLTQMYSLLHSKGD